MSRVNGRTIVATNQEEMAVLHRLGLTSLRVPRKLNPYQVARRLERAAKPPPDEEFLRSVAVRTRVVAPTFAESTPPSEVELPEFFVVRR